MSVATSAATAATCLHCTEFQLLLLLKHTT
jgi:hypothetical protein